MQRVPVSIPAVQVPTTGAAVYTAPTGTTATINNLSITNTTATPCWITLNLVPSGGALAATNRILSIFYLAGGQTYVPPQAIGLHVAAGASLQATAQTASALVLAGGVYETSGS